MNAVVNEARGWADSLINSERVGSDTERAMRRVAQTWGVPYRLLWTLRYRPPKDVPASLYLKLFAAFEANCERQKRRFEHELEISKARGGGASLLHRIAVAVAGKQEGEGDA